MRSAKNPSSIAIRIAADLGNPASEETLHAFLHALDTAWRFALIGVILRPMSREEIDALDSPPDNITYASSSHIPDLVTRLQQTLDAIQPHHRVQVDRVSMTSPNEIDLTAALQPAFGQVAVAVMLFERLVKTAVDWQHHQTQPETTTRKINSSDACESTPKPPNLEVLAETITKEASTHSRPAVDAALQQIATQAITALGVYALYIDSGPRNARSQ